MKLKLKESFDPRNVTKVFRTINDGIESDDDKEALQKYLQQIITYCKGLADDYNVTVVLDEQEEDDSVYEAEDSATQVEDIPKKVDYNPMVKPDFKVGKKLKEAYNYIGKDTGEAGRSDKSHIEHIYTVYDCFGEVDTFKTAEEAERYVEEHKDDELYTEEYGCTGGPDFRIEEDDIEVLNKKIVMKDDLK